jgi:hypothetical protein
MSSSSSSKPKGRPNNKQGRLSGQLTSIVPRNSTFPAGQRLSTVLRYSESVFTGSASVGAYQERLWNLNSLFDPDRTGTGHQPLGYDQLCNLFNRYVVKAVTYTIDVMGLGTASPPGWLAAAPTNAATALVSTSEVREQAHADCVATCTYNIAQIKRRIDLATLTGRTHAQYMTDDAYAGSVSASPTELLILHVGSDNPSGTTASQVYLHYLFEFEVDFYDPNQLGSS